MIIQQNKKNHIKHKNIKYLYGSTKNIKKKLSYKSSIHSIFHFGSLQEFIKVLKILINAMNQS